MRLGKASQHRTGPVSLSRPARPGVGHGYQLRSPNRTTQASSGGSKGLGAIGAANGAADAVAISVGRPLVVVAVGRPSLGARARPGSATDDGARDRTRGSGHRRAD